MKTLMTDYVYQATCPECGGVGGFVVDDPDNQGARRQFVEEFTDVGFSLERVTIEHVRSGEYEWCECQKEQHDESAQTKLPL